MTRRSRRLFAALAATLLLGAACADDDGAEPAGGSGGTAAETGPTTTDGATGTTGATDDGGGRYDYGDGGGDGSDDGGQGEADVIVNNYAFAPSELEAPAGSDLTVKNGNPSTPHTFTIDGTDIDVELEPTKVAGVTLDLDPGDYDFHCRFHSQMTGTITIT